MRILLRCKETDLSRFIHTKFFAAFVHLYFLLMSSKISRTFQRKATATGQDQGQELAGGDHGQGLYNDDEDPRGQRHVLEDSCITGCGMRRSPVVPQVLVKPSHIINRSVNSRVARTPRSSQKSSNFNNTRALSRPPPLWRCRF